MTHENPFDLTAFKTDSEATLKLFEEYCKQQSPNPDFSEDHASEVEHRLWRMTRMIEKINSLQVRLRSFGGGLEELRRNMEEYWNIQHDIEDLTEAYYYCAGRTRGVLKRSIPSLSNFECPGIRDVRNHLLEHPETHGAPILVSRIMGGPEGPIVKPTSQGTESFQDPGLFINAREFVDNLAQQLRSRLGSTDSL